MTSIYIHIPFCQRICSYCDFPKRISNEKLQYEYLRALEKEMDMVPIHEPVHTIYIGGGTPSVLNLKQLSFLKNLISRYTLNDHYEFTIECNPEHITEEKITHFKEMGINRISLGVQTFNDKFLKLLNREHSKATVYQSIELLRNNHIDNINLDLIFAIPFQRMDDVKEDLQNINILKVPHISYYSLILEERTILHKMLDENKIKLVENEIEASMYEYIMTALKEMGYHHYEISNYAKTGFESKHNLVYWQNRSYYAFGMGASGYLNQTRYYNENRLSHYIEKVNLGKLPIKDQDQIKKEDALKETFLLGLRLIDGLSIEEINRRYQVDILDYFKNEFHYLRRNNWIEITDRIKLTHQGLFYGNEVFELFI